MHDCNHSHILRNNRNSRNLYCNTSVVAPPALDGGPPASALLLPLLPGPAPRARDSTVLLFCGVAERTMTPKLVT